MRQRCRVGGMGPSNGCRPEPRTHRRLHQSNRNHHERDTRLGPVTARPRTINTPPTILQNWLRYRPHHVPTTVHTIRIGHFAFWRFLSYDNHHCIIASASRHAWHFANPSSVSFFISIPLHLAFRHYSSFWAWGVLKNFWRFPSFGGWSCSDRRE